MNNLTTEQMADWIKEQSKLLYPDFYENDNEAAMIEPLMTNAMGIIGTRSNELTAPQYKAIGLYLTLYLMWELDHLDGLPTAVKAGSLNVELNANDGNPFAKLLSMWLNMLGWNQYGCQFL